MVGASMSRTATASRSTMGLDTAHPDPHEQQARWLGLGDEEGLSLSGEKCTVWTTGSPMQAAQYMVPQGEEAALLLPIGRRESLLPAARIVAARLQAGLYH